MLKYLVSILFISLALSSSGQVQINQPYKFLSWISVRDSLRAARGNYDSTLQLPTGCGAPSGIASLKGGDKKKAAFFYDSCGHNLYVFNPTDSSWAVAGGAGGLNQLTGDVTAGPGIGSQPATIANNAVTNAKLRQSAGLSVIGNSSNATANVADITAGSDGGVLRRNGTSIGFGAVNLANGNAVTGVLPFANIDTATIKTKISDSLVYALKSILIPSRLEFINTSDTSTYQNDDLIGSQIMMLSIESYQVGFTSRPSSVYASFDSGTGTITLTNGVFAASDEVIIIYRTPPVFLLDGSGNPVRDGSGNFIILN